MARAYRDPQGRGVCGTRKAACVILAALLSPHLAGNWVNRRKTLYLRMIGTAWHTTRAIGTQPA